MTATTPQLQFDPDRTPLAAAAALFAAGAPFAGDRNPALLLGPGGEILAVNDAAQPLATALAAPAAALASAVAAARAGQAGRIAAERRVVMSRIVPSKFPKSKNNAPKSPARPSSKSKKIIRSERKKVAKNSVGYAR